MPKRRNPFADYVPVQWKTHVGVKEIASGTMQAELMKEVYDRTQEKLFSGAKRSVDSDLNANHAVSRMDPSGLGAVQETSYRPDPHQMMLDGAGHLLCPASGMGDREQTSMQCGDTMTDTMLNKTVTDMQGFSCGQFSTWMQSDGASFRYHSPVSSPPSLGDQLCLGANGHFAASAQQHSSMDCDADVPSPPFSEEDARKNHGGVGLERWGFLSSARTSAAPQAGRQPSSSNGRCQTCRHMPGTVGCQFCERLLCGGCGRQCQACGHQFCPLCSTMDYHTSVERAFCLNCVG